MIHYVITKTIEYTEYNNRYLGAVCKKTRRQRNRKTVTQQDKKQRQGKKERERQGKRKKHGEIRKKKKTK